jgi:uncharacterized protein (DUF2147 family)
MAVLTYLKRSAAAALSLLLLLPSAAQARDVVGTWVTDDGKGAVEIERCGDKRCGRLVWLKSPLDEAGRPLRDGNNPDPAARKQPICGLQVIKDVAPQADGTWDGGSVYDPEEGAAYSVMLTAKDEDKLEVTGYLGIKALGESMIWTRAPAELKRCQPEPGTAPKAK